MRARIRTLSSLLVLAAGIAAAFPTVAGTHTYRGSLSDRGAPAEGRYAFRLTFYDAQFGGVPIAAPATLEDVAVSAGAFATEVELDPSLSTRDWAWLEVEVRDAGGGFVPLGQRSEVRPKTTTGGVCWDTLGNAGTNPLTDFIGTADNAALSLRVSNGRVARFEPTGSVPNVVLGGQNNAVTTGALGATTGGGNLNVATDTYATVAGGFANSAGNGSGTTVDAQYAFVGGGRDNRAAATSSVVAGGTANAATGEFAATPGGQFNCAGGSHSFAGGYGAKVRPQVLDPFGACASGVTAGGTGGDQGTFVWNGEIGTAFASTAPGQFLVRAFGGVGINTAATADANLSIASTTTSEMPLLRLFNATADVATSGRVLISENASSSAGGFMYYNAASNEFFLGTNTGASDFLAIRIPRGTNTVGIGRAPAANALEVEGNASKTTATAWLANSDARIKRDVRPIANALDTIMRVRPVTFAYSADYRAHHPSIADRRYYNVLAQEFAEVFPDAVQRSGELLPGAKGGASDEILQVDVHPALITTIAATQELAVRVEQLERDNAQLRALLEGLLARRD